MCVTDKSVIESVPGEASFNLTSLPEIGSDGHREIWQKRVREVRVFSISMVKKIHLVVRKVKRRQKSGTEAIRTQIQLSKPKREITKITNSQNTKRTYGQPSEQLFPKRWQLNSPIRTKNDMKTRKVKRHRNSDTKTGNKEPQQNYCLGTVSNGLLGVLKLVLRAQPHPPFLTWYKSFSWLLAENLSSWLFIVKDKNSHKN